MVAQLLRYPSVRKDEHELIDCLVEQLPMYRREAVINYYVTLKSKQFVILAGPREVNKMCLVEGVAQTLVGTSIFQWSCFQAHPWWSTQTGYPGHFATAHARFNELKLHDLIELAQENEEEGRPFFVGVERMSQAEVECYFHDLPRGLFWRADASRFPIRLPSNVFVTGTFDVDEKVGSAWWPGVSRDTAVIHLRPDDLVSPQTRLHTARSRAGWEEQFVRSRVCTSGQARAKLARMLARDPSSLAPLDELRQRLEVLDLVPFVLEEAWLYLINTFDDQGYGLFADTVAENLAIAQHYVLVQTLLLNLAA